MIENPDIITGCEPASGQNIAIDTLIGFYRAFNESDLAAIAQNWLSGDEPSLRNPIGVIMRGWPAISSGYERLFGGLIVGFCALSITVSVLGLAVSQSSDSRLQS